MNIFCCECRRDMNCNLIKGNVAYPHRENLFSLNFYQCPVCKNFVGVHKGTYRPLGVIANSEIKNARRHIHNLLDPIWKTGKIGRKKCYKLISEELGYEYHTANLKTIDECRTVYRIIQRIKRNIKEPCGASVG